MSEEHEPSLTASTPGIDTLDRLDDIPPNVQSVLNAIPRVVHDVLGAELLGEISRHPTAIALLPPISEGLERLSGLDLGENTGPVYEIFLSLIKSLFHLLSERDYTAFFARMADKFPFPMVRYRYDGYPLIWNKSMEELTGYSHEYIIQYYEQEREKLRGTQRDALDEWRSIIVNLLYQGDNHGKVLLFLRTMAAGKSGYDHIPFTLTTARRENVMVIWSTERDEYDNSNSRFGVPVPPGTSAVTTGTKRLEKIIGKPLRIRSAIFGDVDILDITSYYDRLRRLAHTNTSCRVGYIRFPETKTTSEAIKAFFKILRPKLRAEEQIYEVDSSTFAIPFLGIRHDEPAILDQCIDLWHQTAEHQGYHVHGMISSVEPGLLFSQEELANDTLGELFERALQDQTSMLQELLKTVLKSQDSFLSGIPESIEYLDEGQKIPRITYRTIRHPNSGVITAPIKRGSGNALQHQIIICGRAYTLSEGASPEGLQP